MDLKRSIRKILLESYLTEEEDEDTLYKGLRRYIKGIVSEYVLEQYDPMIQNVRHKGGHLGESIITFDLGNDEKLFELLDLSEDDGWFARVVDDRHSSHEFMDGYQVEDDFKEGYIVFGDLDDENKEKIKKIVFLTLGKEIELGKEEQDDMQTAQFLLNTFSDEIDDILSEYRWAKNDEMTITAHESIQKELNDFFQKIGFSLTRHYDYISTSVGNLLWWYVRTDSKDSNFEELFKSIISETDTSRMGGWYEVSYEFHNSDNFDFLRFNREVEIILDKILDKLEYVDDDLEDFREKYKQIIGKFRMGEWHKIPKDDNYIFTIKGFDPETLNLKIHAKNVNGWRTKPLELSFESLDRLLYQPELFSLSELIPENVKK